MQRRFTRTIAVLILVLATITLGSCNWVLGMFNHMSIDGTRYSLDNLYEYYLGEEEGVHEIWLNLSSRGLTETRTSIDGAGERLRLILLSDDSDLANGEYRKTSQSTWAPLVLHSAFVWVGVDFDRGTIDEAYPIARGTVQVRNLIGDGYAIEFELESEDELGRTIAITGQYRGRVTNSWDYSTLFSTQSGSAVEKAESFR